MKGKSVMRRFALAGALLLSAFVARAEDLTEQHVFVCGYRLTESGSFNSKFTTLPGLSAALTKEGPGCVYREDVQDAEFLNNNVIVAKVPFGYKVGYWIRSYGKDQFIRTKGEKIEGSDGALKLTVPFDGKDESINIGLVILYDNDRTLTVGKSPFGAGKVTVKSGDEEVGVVSDKAKRDFSCQKGDQFRLTAIPDADANTGYDHSTFRRWNDGSTSYERTITVDTNATYVAEFVPNSWTVTLDANGGEVFPTSKVVTCDATYGWLPTPTRTGHRFLDWYIDRPDGEGVNANARVGAIGDHTLLAAWEADRLTVGWARTGDGNGEVSGAGSYPYGEKAKLQALPFEGSQFVCWTDGETRNPRFVTVVSNAEYVAEFAVSTYAVTFAYRDASGSPKTSEPQTVRHGEAAVPPSEDEYDRWAEHVFTNWSTEEYKAVTRDLKVEAIYDAQTYDVSFAYHDRAGNCVTTMPQHVVSGGAAKPPSDSVVNNWTGMSFTGWQPDYNVIGSNCVIEALYVKKEYKVLFSYCDRTGKEVQHVETVQHGDKIPFSYVDGVANQWPGHEFKYWTLDGKMITNKDAVVATRDTVISAVYEGYAKIFFAPGERGGGEMSPQVLTNFSGDVQLKANAFTNDPGYAFAFWVDPASNRYANAAVVTLAECEILNLTAEWNPIEYTIKLDGNGGTWRDKEPTADAVYDQPTSFELRPEGSFPVRRTGYELLPYWSRSATDTNEIFRVNKEWDLTVSNLTTVADATVTLYAQWKANSYKVRFSPGAGGGTMPDQSFTYDAPQALASNAFTRTGWTFAGWTNTTDHVFYRNGVEVSNLTAVANGTVTLTALWDQIPRYQVRFNPNGGNGSMPNQEFMFGQAQALSANAFAAPDWTVFDRWTNSVGTAYANGAVVSNLTAVTNGIVDLYATWKAVPSYTVAYEGNGSTGGAMPTNRFACGEGGTLPANGFVKTGYAFDLWTNKVNGATYDNGATFAEDLAPTNETATLYATWTPNRYTVTFDGNGATGGATEDQAFTYGVAQALRANGFTKTGHTFLNWTNVTERTFFADKAVVSNLTDAADGEYALSAVWKVKRYEISFDSAGGTAVNVQSNDYGAVVTAPPSPTKKGFTFAGWYRGEARYEFGQPMPAENFVLMAHWTPNEYVVRFGAGEGTGTMPDQSFVYDEAQALSANGFTAPEMKVFDRWTNSVGTAYANGAVVSNLTDEANGVVDLYATWKAVPSYTVAYDGNGSTGGAMPTNRFACGEGGTLPANGFVKTGYAFDLWTNKVNGATYDNGAAFAEDLAPTNGTATLYATWTPNRYTVTFDGNGATGGATEKQSFVYGVAQALRANGFTKTGHSFVGWTNATERTFFADKAVVSNLTDVADGEYALSAVWKVKRYEIRFNSAGGTAVNVQSNDYGAVVTAPPSPTKKGFTFAGWLLDGELFDFETEKMPAKNITLVADWVENGHYTVRFNGAGGTDARGQTTYDQVFTNDVEQTLLSNAFTRVGHDFHNWTNAVGTSYANGQKVCNLTNGNETVDLFAKWEAHCHQVTWDYGYKSEVTSVAYGTMLTRDDPTPPTGYKFKCWTSNGVDVTLPIPMPDEDLTLEASWTPITYTIAFDGNGADPGISMGTTNVTYDQEIELPSNRFVRAGYTFANWTNAAGRVFADGAVVSNLTTEDGDEVTLYARWAESTGNPLAIALGLDGEFGVEVDTVNPWTIIGTASEKNGLRLTNGTKDGKLILTIPSKGSLSYRVDIVTEVKSFAWTFNDEEIEDEDGDVSIVSEDHSTRKLNLPGAGELVFYGNPEPGKTWKLSNFKFVKDEQ